MDWFGFETAIALLTQMARYMLCEAAARSNYPTADPNLEWWWGNGIDALVGAASHCPTPPLCIGNVLIGMAHASRLICSSTSSP
jgi:hypothetical protein